MFLSLFQVFTNSLLTCKNPTGGKIPWFAAFKYPPTKDGNAFHESGRAFAYYDSDEGFVEPRGELNMTQYNPLYHTLKPLYDDPNVGFILLNDQPFDANEVFPDNANSLEATPYGHMKGAIIYDEESAVYVEHSCPQFPPPKKYGYFYPDNAVVNAQSFMCLSLEKGAIETIAQNLAISRPIIYDSQLPEFTKKVAPTLYDVVNKKWNKDVKQKRTDFKVGGNDVSLFTKSKDFLKDLYNDYIAQELKTDLYVETWNKGASYLNMPSNCSLKYSTYNVDYVNFLGVSWKSTKDHSKWAVGNDYVCISGTNRQISQTKRGGSSFCIKDSKLASQVRLAIEDFEKCA